MKSEGFPRKAVLWNGAILNGIANAAMAADSTFHGPYAEWVGNHYLLNGLDGRLGAIAFEGGPWSGEGRLAGVFHFPESKSNAFHCKNYDLERFFLGCPAYQRFLVEQLVLSYLQMEDNGRVVPLVTAALWDAGEYLTAAETWEVVVANGAHLIEGEMIEDWEAALARFRVNYGMSMEQVVLVQSLFQRKMTCHTGLIPLTAADVGILESTFEDSRARGVEPDQPAWDGEPTPKATGKELVDSVGMARKAMRLCRELFAAIGIVMPDA
ncbi:MAG TPA: hypothetical protein VMS17_08575 [Gemmataceae bacterium]|nr:hypothetical protein [Gemmataceae bacterium]